MFLWAFATDLFKYFAISTGHQGYELLLEESSEKLSGRHDSLPRLIGHPRCQTDDSIRIHFSNTIGYPTWLLPKSDIVNRAHAWRLVRHLSAFGY